MAPCQALVMIPWPFQHTKGASSRLRQTRSVEKRLTGLQQPKIILGAQVLFESDGYLAVPKACEKDFDAELAALP